MGSSLILINRSAALGVAGAALLTGLVPRKAKAAGVETLALDYAYYNPPSLILKQQGWLEAALSSSGTKVEWVLSLGSNKANSYLAAGAIALGSTAGSAALLARANGSPIRTVFLFSRPEWTALVVGKDSPLRSVSELKGKKIAATRGTDPWFFLLRSLHAAGLSSTDVEIVDLQHPDGRTALERGQVDAWAGLDPHMAASQLDAGSRLLYRNVAYNTFGALNVREDFLAAQPELVATVLRQYERAREFSRSHPADAARALATASHLEERVAQVEIRDRTAYPDPAPGRAYAEAIAGVIPIIRAENLVAAGTDLDAAAAALPDARPIRSALHG